MVASWEIGRVIGLPTWFRMIVVLLGGGRLYNFRCSGCCMDLVILHIHEGSH